jgi:hypothetical protein
MYRISKNYFGKTELPEKARNDALHIAIATHYKNGFLLTIEL